MVDLFICPALTFCLSTNYIKKKITLNKWRWWYNWSSLTRHWGFTASVFVPKAIFICAQVHAHIHGDLTSSFFWPLTSSRMWADAFPALPAWAAADRASCDLNGHLDSWLQEILLPPFQLQGYPELACLSLAFCPFPQDFNDGPNHRKDVLQQGHSKHEKTASTHQQGVRGMHRSNLNLFLHHEVLYLLTPCILVWHKAAFISLLSNYYYYYFILLAFPFFPSWHPWLCVGQYIMGSRMCLHVGNCKNMQPI